MMALSGTQEYRVVMRKCYATYGNNDKDTHRLPVVQETCMLYQLPLTQGISLAAGGIPTPHIV